MYYTTMIIRNRDELATTGARERALEIIEAGIGRVLPSELMESALSYDAARRIVEVKGDAFRLGRGGRLFVVGGGKAGGLMAQSLETIVGADNITAGVVNYKGGQAETKRIKTVVAGHPIPDQRGVGGVSRMLALKGRYSINENDLVICLLSGGGSALLPYPVDGVSLADKQKVTDMLIASGAAIAEINVVRKHLSRVKGGWLGAFYSPARVVSLIVSDVVGNDLATIASGPTSPDPSTFADAYDVLQRYRLLDKAPPAVVALVEKGEQGGAAETPKALDNCYNYIIGDNGLALEAMAARAEEFGLKPRIITSRQTGDTAKVARFRAGEIMGREYSSYDVLLIGGETTVKLPPEPGRGGRNQHYAAVSMLALAESPGQWLVASVGSDGTDFLPDVAGAIVDRGSLEAARAGNLDIEKYIERRDSNTLLREIGHSLIVTGDTGANVGDVIVYLMQGKEPQP